MGGPKCGQVLGTPELLELILLHLPARDRLLAHRVCRSFNCLIRTSPTIKQALFLQPLPETAVSNPTSPAPKLFKARTCERAATESRERNPILISAFLPWFNRKAWRGLCFGTGLEALKALPLADPTTRSAFLRPEASWRQMLMVQPPLTCLEIALCNHFTGRPQPRRCICLDQGITMGTLYDITCQEVFDPCNISCDPIRIVKPQGDGMIHFSDAYEKREVAWRDFKRQDEI
ncbi:hypothetical protein B0J12DRAFT_260137 [Macrophomina phaseolina]|uniref:F-box domain-containing protein n=1 Tax=Macrophomina phaseolina TaxID=35725 RepID=A0ABQ8FYZ1_9PEZI|nr:hypothetical protein B0J12DRAFT_260137 [Macrophomina phaseolina]